jgi:hypothetical protein
MDVLMSQELVLGLLFIIAIAIIILSKDKLMVISIISLITSLFVISSQFVIMREKRVMSSQNNNLRSYDQIDNKDDFVSEHSRDCDEPLKYKKESFTVSKKQEYEGAIDYEADETCSALNGNVDTNDEYNAAIILERGKSERVNPKYNGRLLMEKYVMPEVDEEETKAWWGRDE